MKTSQEALVGPLERDAFAHDLRTAAICHEFGAEARELEFGRGKDQLSRDTPGIMRSVACGDGY